MASAPPTVVRCAGLSAPVTLPLSSLSSVRMRMSGLTLLGMLLCAGAAVGQVPSPCFTPSEFTARVGQLDHVTEQFNRYYVAYDAVNQRRALIEEQDVMTPGRQFLQFLMLAKLKELYEINLTKKTCRKLVMTRPWRPYGIPPNATFETEFYIGGPGEQVFAQEWSDRIPFRRRAFWTGVFSLNNCYPVHEVVFADYREINSTITSQFYDVVQGIVDPRVFIPPPECLRAPWAEAPSRLGPLL